METESQEKQQQLQTSKRDTEENEIVNNKLQYISLNENSSLCEDVTKDIQEFIKTLSNEEMIHTQDFTLESTMSAIELNHYKMDYHCHNENVQTYKTLKRLDIIKSIDELTISECLYLMNSLFRREVSWMYGGSLQHSILNLIYFSDESINDMQNEYNEENISLFRTYLHSIFHILYLVYSNILKCGCLRDEDFGSMFYPNTEYLKRENVLNEIKIIVHKIKTQTHRKEIDKQLSEQIINRLTIQKLLILLFESQLNSTKVEKYDTLIEYVHDLKNELNVLNLEYVPEKETFDITPYFSVDLIKLLPNLCNNTSKEIFNNETTITKFTQFISDLQFISNLYETTNMFHLLRNLEQLNKLHSSFIIKEIIDLNLFSTSNPNTFGKFDLLKYQSDLLEQLKIKLPDDNIENYILSVSKELLKRKLLNQARQIAESSGIIDNLTVVALEGHNKENALKQNNKKTNQHKSTLTNFLLKNVLTEMFNIIILNFKVEMFKVYELDYVFFVCENITNLLSMHNYIIVANYGEKVLKDSNVASSTIKKKFSTTQKMFIDETYIYSTLKVVFNSLKLLIHYIKKNQLIKLPKSEPQQIKKRIVKRFPYFGNCGMFLDISYDTFMNDIEKEEMQEDYFEIAGENIKGCAKHLSELKGAPQKLRDCFMYSDDYINNLSKAIIANRLLFNKIKKMKNEQKVGTFKVNMEKYDTFLPLIEVS